MLFVLGPNKEMINIKEYSTSQIATIVGVHPNTVRMYEEWGLLQKPKRKQNGYRIFTDVHIDQFQLAKIGLKSVVLQGGLRNKMIETIKLSADWKFEEAIHCIQEYLAITDKESANAREAVAIVNALIADNEDQIKKVSLRRSEAAKELGITIDAIRNWEMNGLIKVKRKENGYRVYDSDTMKKLKIIRSLRCANYSLQAILRMMNAFEENHSVDTIRVLNTPKEDEDIISACDKLIDSLEEAKNNATKVLGLLIDMNRKYMQ